MATITELKAKLESLKVQRTAELNNLRNSGKSFLDRDREAYKAIADQEAEVEKELTALKLKEEIKGVNDFNRRSWEAWQEVKDFDGTIFKADGSHTKKFQDFLNPIKEKFNLHIYAKYWSSGEEYKMSENTTHSNHSRSFYHQNPPTENLPDLDFKTVQKARIQHNKFLKELEDLQKKLNDNYFIAVGRHDLKEGDRKQTFSHI